MIVHDPVRTVAPTALPVTLAEFKAQARVEQTVTDEDALMQAYIRAAVEHIEDYAKLSLITQTWEQRFSEFKSGTRLWRKPLQSITSIEYLDADDDEQTLAATVYRATAANSDKEYPTVRLIDGQSWPTILDDAEAVRVTFQTGYGDTHNDVPEIVRHAVLLTAATWINHREDVAVGVSISELPWASKALLRDYRPLAVA